jgi:hypothetical protein
MKALLILFVGLFGFSGFLSFSLSSAAAADAADPRSEMQLLAREIVALQKFMLTEAKFLAPENAGEIKKSIDSLEKHLGKLRERDSFKGDPVLKTNLEMLSSHLQETNRLFDTGNKTFARYMLQSSMQMCIACHTREKSADFALPDAELSGLGPMEKANFYFATRQFERGRAEYAAAVAGFPKNDLGIGQLHSALLALAVYHARVKESPADGAAYFSQVAARKDLPVYVQRQTKRWAADFSDWAKEKKANEKTLTENQYVRQAKKLLAADDFSLVGDSDGKFHIRRLRASSLLHRALEAGGGRSPAKAEATLLLGQIYQRLSYQLFFRFGEMYLKACIREYRKTATARACYDALEQAVAEGYTGSAGTSIPEEEQVELFQLKRLAY